MILLLSLEICLKNQKNKNPLTNLQSSKRFLFYIFCSYNSLFSKILLEEKTESACIIIVKIKINKARRVLFIVKPLFTYSKSHSLFDEMVEKNANTTKYKITKTSLAFSAPNLYIKGSSTTPTMLVMKNRADKIKIKGISFVSGFLLNPTTNDKAIAKSDINQIMVYLENTIFFLEIPLEIRYLFVEY